MKYDEEAIKNLYQENLTKAHQLLTSLPVAEGREPNTKGLNGWVYEQTIRHCLSRELTALGLHPNIEEQVPLKGRTKIDLLVGRVAIEIKAIGSFGEDAKKYSEYRAKVEERGWVYFYLTGSETYNRYRSAIESALGKNHSFFLDVRGDWERFVGEVVKDTKKSLDWG